MESQTILKELNNLKSRLDKLESKSNVLGGSYTQLGSSKSDLLLKTRGKIKVQYGNSYFDLVKEGQVANQQKFLFKESEVGSKDGIYLIDNKDVYLVVDSNPYKLDSIPSGTIFLFNGDTIPEGYKICNGEDNTPNITFIDYPDIKYIIKI